MSDQLTIAWATKVDASQLGARLEAYSETKSAIEAFMKLKSHLPAEVKEIITNAVKDQAYSKIIGSWLQAESCYDAYCTIESHFTAQELHDEANIGCDLYADPIDISCLDVECEERHHNAVVSHLAKMNPTGRGEKTGYSDISQDFTNDFGIHPYFDILDRHDRSTYHKQMVFESAKVSALLMLPLNKASFEAQSGYKQSTVVMEQSLSVPDIGSSAMMAPRFKVAIKALRLNAGHIHGAPEPPQAVCNCKEEYGDDDDTDDTPGSLESSHLVEIGDNDENESKVSLDEPNRVSADVQNITVRSASAEQTDDESETSSDDGREDSEGGSGGGLFCFDCDSTDCDGIVQKIKDPALMILGSGKLKTYGQLELYH